MVQLYGIIFIMECKHRLELDECSSCNPRSNSKAHSCSLKEDIYEGKPIIEVLINGLPISVTGGKKHFSFGCTRAKLIINCMEIVKDFSINKGNIDINKHNKLFKHDDVIITIEAGKMIVTNRKGSFITSWGKVVNKPYIELKSGNVKIAFGLTKAGALIELESQIREWIDNNC